MRGSGARSALTGRYGARQRYRPSKSCEKAICVAAVLVADNEGRLRHCPALKEAAALFSPSVALEMRQCEGVVRSGKERR